jgi:ABC-type phosphate transport system substrate-binding protein
MRAIHKIAVLGAAVVAFGSIGMGTALADPYPPLSSPPPLTSIEGVGSDTITPLFSGNELYDANGNPSGGQTSGDLTQDYDATNPANLLYSWDAVNPKTGLGGDTITTKASSSSDTSCDMTRPNGSSAGIVQLNLKQEDSTEVNSQPVYCVDYARSSRAPNNTSTDDTFVAIAGDAIGWTYPQISGATNPQPTSLTITQLTNIYNCTDTTWGQVLGTSDTTPVGAVLPQAGSGTRATWLANLGITATSEPCWINGTAPNGDAIEENTGLSPGNVSQFTTNSTVNGVTIPPQDDIFPYSIGDWIAQSAPVTGTGAAGTPGGATVGGHATSIWGQGNLIQGEVPDVLGIDQEPVTTNSDSQPVINLDWNPTLTRTLYVVTLNGGTATSPSLPTSPAYEATGLTTLFGPNGWVCTNNVAQSDIVSYGFDAPPSGCGTLSAGD